MTTADQTFIGLPFKYVSLISLTLQNSLLAILLHHSRTIPNTKLYSASAAVLLNEILKCSISFLVALYNACNQSSSSSTSINHTRRGKYHPVADTTGDETSSLNSTLYSRSSQSHHEIHSPFSSSPKISVSPFEQDFQNWKLNSRSYSRMIIDHSKQILIEIISTDCWKLSIPAVLYVIQNNLQFVAAANLDVATFSVTYQLKILTTALCSVVMLGRQLSVKKWTALFFLAVGVALVQLQNITTTTTEPIKGVKNIKTDTSDRFLGFMAVTSACFTSGLAGVYFELVLKSSNKVDLWIRNIQLSLFSLIPALFTTLFTTNYDGNDHIFSNFGVWAWATVLTQVVGGLVTALVIKFADNILKGFATSLSIILSTLAGVFIFGTPLPLGSAAGSLVVLAATFAYNSSDDPHSNLRPSNSISFPLVKGPTGFISPLPREKQRTL
ncbi:hypothetical protein MJO29_010703 [Puccinia striiformis f. sp. tritici]|uniref:hypothetical protein n=1 Tax=Puccinia striiformis f. sp. tritici TaxID=168172 RepID=UPI0020074655|nr:hypothetical protein Pst134EA_019780 [Puccinia striiformis f. sp. tritici]KAH9459638.1 hypothetical protein Pst134EA_019780 [Puccinia striiformis f. sp. tritici]KAI7949038.1 hypothetical protein MJO29_010703 [Puccinia striiformis f. sp. tritici]